MKPDGEASQQQADEVSRIRKYAVVCYLLWAVLIFSLYIVYVLENRQAVHEISHNMALASFEKDLLFRRWASRHGGVYVPETADTPANPNLSTIPERDISTPSGRRLTLMNPAYMNRQIFELAREQEQNAQGHITSLNPLRPENAPDPWETNALKLFEKGEKEVLESVLINGQPYLRFMRPLFTEKPCLKCHAAQGYKEGDNRGGISVTLPLLPIMKVMNRELRKEAVIHFVTLLFGFGFIWFGSRKIQAVLILLRDERNKLVEAENLYRSLFTRAGDGIFIITTDGNIIELNESFARMHGYTVSEMLNMNLKDLDAPETARKIPERMQRLMAGESLTFEVEHYHKDGHLFPLEVSAGLIFTGGKTYIQCFHRDITERKLAEARLAESESYLRSIISNEPECIKVIDEQGLLLQMNPAGLAMVEADSQEQVIGQPVLELIAPEHRTAYADLLKRVMSGETMHMKYEILGLKGGRCWVETHAVPMQIRDQILHLAVTQDISERKRAEDALGLSKHQLSTLIEALPDAVFLKDEESRWLVANKVALELFGLSGLTWHGKNETELKLLQPAAADALQCCIESDELAWKHKGQLFTQERIPSGDGKYRDFDVIKVPLIENNGNRKGMVIVGRDVTMQKRAEEERQKLELQLHHTQKLESLGVLAGGIAHDFNNILTVILGHCFLAKEEAEFEKSYDLYFQPIENAANRAAELCRQILIYAGKSPLVQTHVKLDHLINEVVKMLQAAINKNVAIELVLENDVPMIIGDIGQIQQIVMNLIINAAEAVGDVSGLVRIILTEENIPTENVLVDVFGTHIQAGRYACIEVTDTGIGMDEETQKRIFDPFFTTKFTGRGLGLSAIHGIISSHDGAMLLSSIPGTGTTFKVLFPLHELHDDPVTSHIEVLPSDKSGGTILFVEDEQTLRSMGVLLLETLGFSTLTAQNGREALDIFREQKNRIDLVLLDLIMPVMGGVEAYHELRSIDASVPVIVCSGYGIDSVADVLKNDEFARFIKKPYKPEELRDLMTKMIDQYIGVEKTI